MSAVDQLATGLEKDGWTRTDQRFGRAAWSRLSTDGERRVEVVIEARSANGVTGSVSVVRLGYDDEEYETHRETITVGPVPGAMVPSARSEEEVVREIRTLVALAEFVPDHG